MVKIVMVLVFNIFSYMLIIFKIRTYSLFLSDIVVLYFDICNVIIAMMSSVSSGPDYQSYFELKTGCYTLLWAPASGCPEGELV